MSAPTCTWEKINSKHTDKRSIKSQSTFRGSYPGNKRRRLLIPSLNNRGKTLVFTPTPADGADRRGLRAFSVTSDMDRWRSVECVLMAEGEVEVNISTQWCRCLLSDSGERDAVAEAA